MEVGAVVAVVAVAVGGFAGRLTSGDGENSSDLSVRLLSMTTESSSQVHGFPQWWSDGESLVRFGAAQEGLTLSPLEPDWSVDLPDPRRLLAESDGIKAMAVAARPGGSRSHWVAVGTPDVEMSADEQPILAWSATGDIEAKAPKVRPAALPVDTVPTTSSESIISVDAAMTAFGDQDVAVVQVSQSGQSQLVRCDLDGDVPCAWSPVEAPDVGERVELAATANAIVAVSWADEESPSIWFAADESLTWERIGSAPSGMKVVDLVDGIDSVNLVWRNGDDITVQVLTPGNGSAALETVIARSAVPGEPEWQSSAARVGGTWYLGASVPADPEVALTYGPSAPGLWR